MTKLMADAIGKMMNEEDERTEAKKRFLNRIKNAPDRGTNGVISWTRDELYER